MSQIFLESDRGSLLPYNTSLRLQIPYTANPPGSNIYKNSSVLIPFNNTRNTRINPSSR